MTSVDPCSDESSCVAYLERARELATTTTDPQLILQLKFLMAELNTFINGYPPKGIQVVRAGHPNHSDIPFQNGNL